MKSKQHKVPLIEAFVLTGLLIEFIPHASPMLGRVAPTHLAQATLEQKSVAKVNQELHARPQGY